MEDPTDPLEASKDAIRLADDIVASFGGLMIQVVVLFRTVHRLADELRAEGLLEESPAGELLEDSDLDAEP